MQIDCHISGRDLGHCINTNSVKKHISGMLISYYRKFKNIMKTHKERAHGQKYQEMLKTFGDESKHLFDVAA